MRRRAVLLGMILPVLATGQAVVLATGARAGLADNQADCSFQGPVRSIRIERTEIGEDGRESNRELKTSCTFDRNGHTLEDKEYRNQGQYGKVVSTWIFRYDSHGRRIEGDVFDSDEDSKHPRRFLTKYDFMGREWEIRPVDPDGIVDLQTVKMYDGRGDLVKETTYESDGKPSGVIVRKYDAAHHLIREESPENAPGAVWKKIFRYNNNGDLLEEILYQTNYPANAAARYVYAYDERGRVLSVETVTASDPNPAGNVYGFCGDCGIFPGKTMYRYNDHGLLTEERVFQPGNKLIRLSQYAYDAHGHHTQEWVYSADPSSKYSRSVKVRIDGDDLQFDRTNGLRSISYSYDSHGNWTKAVATRLSSDHDLQSVRIVSSTAYRAIEYY